MAGRKDPREQQLGESLSHTPRPGDAEWIRAALRRYEGQLVSYALHLVRDPDRARDLVQETFLRLCGQSADSRARIAQHLAEWLFTVCRNLAIDQRRKDRRMGLLNDAVRHFNRDDFGNEPFAAADWMTSDEPEPADAAEQSDTVSHILRTMKELPGNQQEVIRLKFQHGLSYKQISEVTKLSVTNVGFLIHTGIKTLKRRLAVEPS
jgi:RNA polymerase sigma factor (sigma-70 family)